MEACLKIFNPTNPKIRKIHPDGLCAGYSSCKQRTKSPKVKLTVPVNPGITSNKNWLPRR